MTLGTRTYAELIAFIEALSGVDLTTGETARVDPLINAAARAAKRASNYWERFLVVGEPRSVINGLVDDDEDSFHVFGAGTSSVNGLYVSADAVNGKVSYERVVSVNDTDTPIYDIRWNGSDAWQIVARQYITVNGEVVTVNGAWLYQAGDVMYEKASVASTPPTGAWDSPSGVEGAVPAPVIVDVAEIETAMYWEKTDFRTTTPRSHEFASDSNGIRPWGNGTDGIIYVTYAKRLTDKYGDGTGGTVASIPEEWFEYIGHYAARMLQISTRQSNENPGVVIAFREVEQALRREIMRIESQGTPNLVRETKASALAYDNTL